MRARQQELLAGFNVRWIDELPKGITGCIFSNEFFDALPVHRVVRRGGVLKEIYVTENFKEIEAPLQEPVDVAGPRKVTSPKLTWKRGNGFAELQRRSIAATTWPSITVTYAMSSTHSPAGTLMCYWRHQAVEDPYIRIGEQDITAHVNFSDLMERDRRSKRFVSRRRWTI